MSKTFKKLKTTLALSTTALMAGRTLTKHMTTVPGISTEVVDLTRSSAEQSVLMIVEDTSTKARRYVMIGFDPETKETTLTALSRAQSLQTDAAQVDITDLDIGIQLTSKQFGKNMTQQSVVDAFGLDLVALFAKKYHAGQTADIVSFVPKSGVVAGAATNTADAPQTRTG